MANDASSTQSEPVAESGFDWAKGWETLARVSLAGCAGTLVGLAKEKQQQQQQTEAPADVHPNDAKQHRRRSRRQRPPLPPPRSTPTSGRLAATWSVSCMIFAVVLESFRHASPTSFLLQHYVEQEAAPSIEATITSDTTTSNTSSPPPPPRSLEDAVKLRAGTSIGDYTLGGAVAGLAGAMGQQKKLLARGAAASGGTRRPSLTAFGLATGMGLGLIAGVVQAAVDVGDLYLAEEEQRKQEENKKGKDDDAADEKA